MTRGISRLWSNAADPGYNYYMARFCGEGFLMHVAVGTDRLTVF